MENWIFNASPLILLGKIGRVDIIGELNSKFSIPSAVADDINAGPALDPAKLWLSKPSNRQHVLEPLEFPAHLLAWDLGAGETAVLAHSIAEAGQRAILDDRSARNCAEVYGISIIGTVGLLIRAKQAGLVSLLRPELIRLVESGSLLSRSVIEEALKIAGEYE